MHNQHNYARFEGLRLIKSRNQRYSDFGLFDRPDKLTLHIVKLFDVGDELRIVPMFTKSVKGSSAKVLKLSLMALRPCYQFSTLVELYLEQLLVSSQLQLSYIWSSYQLVCQLVCQLVGLTLFPDNRSKDFLDIWHKDRP